MLLAGSVYFFFKIYKYPTIKVILVFIKPEISGKTQSNVQLVLIQCLQVIFFYHVVKPYQVNVNLLLQ